VIPACAAGDWRVVVFAAPTAFVIKRLLWNALLSFVQSRSAALGGHLRPHKA
jgi:hypothetical protein